MSKTIDERVVSMKFDNRDFESNAKKTVSSIEKLKRALNFRDSSKGLEDVNRNVSKIDMSKLGSAVDTVKERFSAMEVIALTALFNIANKAITTGQQIISSLTIEPIKMGFQEYETQINATQTILANTSHKGKTIKDVTRNLDELNTYADKTIYNFTEMTKNIGTFTAAGVDLDTSTQAIKGIANIAAMSGSTSQQASTAMYQLSQALAAGTVKLQDWNSVVNAGMGGEVFQNALKETARVHGVAVDDIIKKEGSFRESLSHGWITSEILTETLNKFTGDMKETDLLAKGYTKQQTAEIMKMAKMANEAATKVKTFSQLKDTLKEAVQSGWAQSWRIIIGDFEEAKELFTVISDYAGDILNKSADARNNMLKNWKAQGGRDDLLEGLKNSLKGIESVIRPVQEAFREIFPRMTSSQLLEITRGFKELTSHFKLSDTASKNLKDTFKGLFSILDLIKTGLASLFGIAGSGGGILTTLGGIILQVTGALGRFVTAITNSIKSSVILQSLGSDISDIFHRIGLSIKNAADSVSSSKLSSIFESLLSGIKISVEAIMSLLKKFGATLKELFSNPGFNFLDIVNTLMLGGFGTAIYKLFNGMKDSLESLNILGNIKQILGDVGEAIKSFQMNVKAEALKKTAIAIGVLAASLFLIATIDSEKLTQALASITFLFGNLFAIMVAFDKIKMASKFKKMSVNIASMIALSSSILILAFALRQLASLNVDELVKGFVGVSALMAVMVQATKSLAANSPLALKGAGQFVIFAVALKILASVCEDLSTINIEGLAKGLGGIGILLGELTAFGKLTKNIAFDASSSVALIGLSVAIKILTSALIDISSLNLQSIGIGLGTIGASLGIFAGVLKILSKSSETMLKSSVSIAIISGSMILLGTALNIFAAMDIKNTIQALIALGGSLVILGIALNVMKGTIMGSIALTIASAALLLLVPTLMMLSTMSLGGIVIALVGLAGAFAVIGAAGVLLGPLSPLILALSVAIGILGLAIIGIGAGLIAIGAGLAGIAAGIAALQAVLASSTETFKTTMTTIITATISIIPEIIKQIGLGIVELCDVIVNNASAFGNAFKSMILTGVDVITECAPAIIDGIFTVIVESLRGLAEKGPQIVDYLFEFLIGILQSLAEHIPELVKVGIELVLSFFSGIMDALREIDTSVLIDALEGAGVLAAFLLALSALAPLIPSAMIGLLGVGVIVAEMALILAALGAFAQIPGLDWFINEGGALLQNIGHAIGQFVGGIVGGALEAISDSFPNIASNLSQFMTNLQPFITGAQSIDASTLTGVKTLAETILLLTGASILEGLASWVTGGSSITKFAEDLAALGPSLKSYSASVSGLDPNIVINSANAAKALSELANNLPNSGGLVSWFTGDNDLASFGTNLASFGKGFNNYYISVSAVDPGRLSAITTEFGKLINVLSGVEKLNSSAMSSFGINLRNIGNSGINEFINAFNNATSRVNDAGSRLVTELVKGASSKKVEFSNTATKIIEECLKTIKATESKWNEYGKVLIENLKTGIGTGGKSVSEKTRSIIVSAADGIRSQYETFFSIGGYLVQGFANGISSNSYLAAARASAMASNAAIAAKRALDIQSPSRVLYKIGRFFTLGFSNAISDHTINAVNASKDMAESSLNAFKNIIGRITDVVDGEVDTNITIKPVLDLSNVLSGSKQISSLLSRNHATSINSNILQNRITGVNVQNDNLANTKPVSGNVYQFTQNNYSPKALSRIDIYRQTKNQFSMLKGAVEL
nr:MAG TPA: tail tape measure [Caudoviricetes sp.]